MFRGPWGLPLQMFRCTRRSYGVFCTFIRRNTFLLRNLVWPQSDGHGLGVGVMSGSFDHKHPLSNSWSDGHGLRVGVVSDSFNSVEEFERFGTKGVVLLTLPLTCMEWPNDTPNLCNYFSQLVGDRVFVRESFPVESDGRQRWYNQHTEVSCLFSRSKDE